MLSRVPGVLCEQAGTNYVLLDPERDRYVRLNTTGGWLFLALDAPRTPEQLARRLVAERGAPPERALADTLAFAADLVRRGVLRAA